MQQTVPLCRRRQAQAATWQVADEVQLTACWVAVGALILGLQVSQSKQTTGATLEVECWVQLAREGVGTAVGREVPVL
jgi:hypothetical protein